MARTNTLTNFLTDVADSIRSKTGKSELIACEDFDTEIESISGGGSANLQTKSVTITQNGTTTVEPDTGYDGLGEVEITTNVQSGSFPNKYITATAWNETTGYPTEIYVKASSLPAFAFGNSSTSTYGFTSSLKKVVFDETISGNFLNNQGIFKYCENLEQVIGFERFSGIIPYGCFQGCKNLILTELPSGLQSNQGNASYAFYGCYKITISEIPSNITNIGMNMFQYCNGIKKMQLNNVEKLRDNVFANCSGLICVAGNKLYGINGSTGNSASFGYCSSLKAIWIGDEGNKMTINDIGRRAFFSCGSLLKIFINRPRSFVETMSGYQYAFMENTSKTGIIVCNDDAGWLTKEQFDAIDWETYTP